MIEKTKILLLGILVLIFLILISAAFIFTKITAKPSRPNNTAQIFVDGTPPRSVPSGTVDATDDKTSALIVGNLRDVYNDGSNVYIDLQINNQITKILFNNSDIISSIQIQSAPALYPTSKDYVSKNIQGHNAVNAIQPFVGEQVVLDAWLGGPKARLNPDYLKCNNSFIALLQQGQLSNLNCTPFIFDISVYEPK